MSSPRALLPHGSAIAVGREDPGPLSRDAPRQPPGPAEPSRDGSERTVLFLCVENACRSLLAEAIFNADPPPGWRARSAGTSPATRPNPRVLGMLREIDIDGPLPPPTLATVEMMVRADRRITMGCLESESCPARLRELEVTDWALPDPARLEDEGFRRVRDELRLRVRKLVEELGLPRPASPQGPDPSA